MKIFEIVEDGKILSRIEADEIVYGKLPFVYLYRNEQEGKFLVAAIHLSPDQKVVENA